MKTGVVFHGRSSTMTTVDVFFDVVLRPRGPTTPVDDDGR